MLITRAKHSCVRNDNGYHVDVAPDQEEQIVDPCRLQDLQLLDNKAKIISMS